MELHLSRVHDQVKMFSHNSSDSADKEEKKVEVEEKLSHKQNHV